jgi:hypothetical protein
MDVWPGKTHFRHGPVSGEHASGKSIQNIAALCTDFVFLNDSFALGTKLLRIAYCVFRDTRLNTQYEPRFRHKEIES